MDGRMLNAARMNIESAEMEDVIEVTNKTSFDSKKDTFPAVNGV